MNQEDVWIDREWLELLLEARNLGITPEEIRKFFIEVNAIPVKQSIPGE